MKIVLELHVNLLYIDILLSWSVLSSGAATLPFDLATWEMNRVVSAEHSREKIAWASLWMQSLGEC